MKFQLSVLSFGIVTVSVWASELAVNWREALSQTPPGAAVVNGWRLNNFQKNPKIGTGEVVESDGVKYFQIETTGLNTSFHTVKNFPAKAGDILEIEVTAKGKGHLIVSCCCYQSDSKFFSPADDKIQYIIPKNEKKTWIVRKKLTDGKNGEKLGKITLTLSAGGISSLSIYDYKAKIVK